MEPVTPERGRVLRSLMVAEERVPLGNARVAQTNSAPAQTGSQEAEANLTQLRQQLIDAHALASKQQQTIERLQAEVVRITGVVEQLRAEQKDAFEESSRRGYTEGREKALAEAKRELAEQATTWARTSEGLQREYERKIESFAGQCIELVLASVTKLLGEHALNPSIVKNAVEQTLKEAGVNSSVRILLAPAQFDLLTRTAAHALASWRDRRVEVAPDPRVSVGGCIVESAQGVADARFDVQLEKLRQVLSAHVVTGAAR